MSSEGVGIGIGDALHTIAAQLRANQAGKREMRDREALKLQNQLDQIAANKSQISRELEMIPKDTPDYISKTVELQKIQDIMQKSTQDLHALGADDPGWLAGSLKSWFGRKQPPRQPYVQGATQTPELLSAAAERPDFASTPAGMRAAGDVKREISLADLEAKAPVERKIKLADAQVMAKFQKDLQEELDAASDKYAEENGLSDEQKKNLKAMHARIPPALLVKQQAEEDMQPIGVPHAVNGQNFQTFRKKDGTTVEKPYSGQLPVENKGVDERAMDAWLALPENKGKNESDYIKWKQVLSSAEESALTLSPEALDIAARRYLQDGTLPPMGMGKQSTTQREKILNRAAQLDPEANIAGNVASYASQKSALTQIEKTISAVESFESTALKNLDQFIKTARKVVDSGSPWVNQVLRTVSKSGLGSADTAAYDAARQVAMTEIARVVSNPNLTGVLSDSARHEMDAVLSGNATLKQIVSAAEILKADMKNRSGSLKTQRETIKKDLSQTPGDLKAKAQGGEKKVKMPDGRIEVFDASGKHLRTEAK